MEISCVITFLKFLLSTLLFVIFLVPLLLVILIFSIYRTFVLIILKFKFGSQFGGILTGFDAFFASDVGSGCIINILAIVKTKSNFEEFFRKFKEEVDMKVFRNPQRFPKFLSRRNKLCGYHYLIQNQITIEKCIGCLNLHSTEEEITKEELMQHISNYSNKALPYNNTAMWEFSLCEKPVRWHTRTDKSENSYAVLLRFHHCLADGVNLVKFVTNIFSVSLDDKKIVLPAQNNVWIKIRAILDSIFILLMSPIVILSQKLFWYVEVSSMDVPSLSNQQIMVVKTEESRECLKIIKGIKKNAEQTSFVQVLLAAISKSLSNYLEKKGKDPNLTNFGSYLTVLTKKLDMTTDSKIANMFSYIKLNIPIIYKSNAPFSNYNKCFMETLEKVKMETKHLSTSFDYKVTYGIVQLVTAVLPDSIMARLVTPPYIPLVITNLPGPSAMTVLDDCLVEDILFFIPCQKPVGIALGIFSYDERLQITLNVDKAIISNEIEAQDIVDGIYLTLIQLDTKI